MSDVDPVMLSDHLIENEVISVEEWDRMKTREVTRYDVCRALLNHLCLQHHPKAFLVVRKALEKENHWLLQEIDRPTQRHSHMRTSKVTGQRFLDWQIFFRGGDKFFQRIIYVRF